MGKCSIIDINNNQIMKHLDDLCNSKDYNQKISYTQKIDLFNIQKIISNKFYQNKHQFLFENNKSNLTLIGFGAADVIEMNKLNDLNAVKSRMEQQLNSIFDISKNKDITIKFFGGYQFDFDTKKTTTWSKFPKGYFVLPECLITIENDDVWMTVIKQIKTHDNPQSIAQNINNIYNNIHDSEISIIDAKQSKNNNYEDNIDKEGYLAIINKIITKIKLKNIQKVVYARSKKIEINKPLNIPLAMQILKEKYPNCINFFLNIPKRGTFFGSSPERLVNNNNNNITTEAIAGTINRGNNLANDLVLENILRNNQKYINEHEIVINEIKRILKPNLDEIKVSKKPAILKLHSLQHLITTITGTLKNNMHILDLVKALHPTPAVAGIPTDDVIKLIHEYENHDRGWYSAPIGWVDKSGNGDFCVSLRSGYTIDNIMHIFSGAGIVKKSIPEDEWEETEMKFKTILSIFDKSNEE